MKYLLPIFAERVKKEKMEDMAIKIEHLNYVYGQGTAFEQQALKT